MERKVANIDNKPNNCDTQNPKVEEQPVVENTETKGRRERERMGHTSLEMRRLLSMKENTRYVYEGTGNEYASYNVMHRM